MEGSSPTFPGHRGDGPTSRGCGADERDATHRRSLRWTLLLLLLLRTQASGTRPRNVRPNQDGGSIPP